MLCVTLGAVAVDTYHWESNLFDPDGLPSAAATSVAFISVFCLKQPRQAKRDDLCYRSWEARSRGEHSHND